MRSPFEFQYHFQWKKDDTIVPYIRRRARLVYVSRRQEVKTLHPNSNRRRLCEKSHLEGMRVKVYFSTKSLPSLFKEDKEDRTFRWIPSNQSIHRSIVHSCLNHVNLFWRTWVNISCKRKEKKHK
jgi:hypothetical protein